MEAIQPAPEQVLSRHGIGGGQAAAIIGVHPFQGQIDVWRDLSGCAEPFEGNRFTEWGLRLEGVVRGCYASHHDECAIYVPAASMFAPPGQEWMRATPDGIVLHPTDMHTNDPGAWHYGLEVKTADLRSTFGDQPRWGESGSDVYPIEYRVQMLWYMHVTGLDRWDLAALIGGNDYREYRIDRTPEVQAEIDSIVEDVTAFWNDHVLTEVAPPPDATENYARYLASKHPSAVTGEIIEVTPDDHAILGSIDRLRTSKAAIKRHEARILEASNAIKAYIGDNAGVQSDLGVVKWTERKGSVRWKAVAESLYLSWFAELANAGITGTPLEDQIEAFRGTPSRSLATPRNWNKS